MTNFKKFFYKVFNKKRYQELKSLEKRTIVLEYYKTKILDKIIRYKKIIDSKKEINFLHSGHLGDIVYSFPLIKELSKNHTCNFYININKKMPVRYDNHPSGQVYLDKRIAGLFLPLVKSQKFINDAQIYENQKIDINLDLFREVPIDIKFHSTRWYMHLTGVSIDMSEPYLNVESHQHIKNNILIVRSPRYRNDFINYNFLNQTKEKIICVGIKDEFNDLKKTIKNLEFYDCKNFLELAQLIKSCRMFIGNECFAYSVAEALKVPRLLEACPAFPVVFPIGGRAYDFYHQIHLENYFKKLYQETNEIKN
mgnify:FL=1|tara:strand:+ start:1036 stop:1965 length:930 start_codon:yes stop_codon:yes gene_type:complete